jgi:hypothetical protein
MSLRGIGDWSRDESDARKPQSKLCQDWGGPDHWSSRALAGTCEGVGVPYNGKTGMMRYVEADRQHSVGLRRRSAAGWLSDNEGEGRVRFPACPARAERPYSMSGRLAVARML